MLSDRKCAVNIPLLNLTNKKVTKFKITIAIPTFNRVERLNQLIESIESQNIPAEVDLKVAISNTASKDDTFIYLNLLSKYDTKKYRIHNKRKYIPNWYNLLTIVPTDTDYVWLIGDDDELTSNDSLSKLYAFLSEHTNLPAVFVPASSKVHKQQVEIGTVEELCNKYGLHKLLGWLSSHVLRYDIYSQIYENFGHTYSFKHVNPRDCYKKKIGLFLHSTITYDVTFGQNIALLVDDIVSEQAYQRDITTILRDGDYGLKKFYSFRFFFDISDIYKINISKGFIPDEKFFQYGFSDFLTLLIDILVEGYAHRSITKKELEFFIKIIRSEILIYFSGHQRNYTDLILHLLLELAKKSPRRSLNNPDLLKLLKIKKYDSNIQKSPTE